MEPQPQRSGVESTYPGDPQPGPAVPVMLFDGVCNLCNGSVQFIVKHERPGAERPLHFASLQSAAGQRLLRRHHLPTDALESVVLVDGERAWTHSSAVLRLCRRLRAPWRFGAVFLVVPRWLRDFAYDRVARNRYRLFGKKDQCMIPSPAMRARFLED